MAAPANGPVPRGAPRGGSASPKLPQYSGFCARRLSSGDSIWDGRLAQCQGRETAGRIEWLLPVCAPALYKKYGPVRNVDDLRRYPLLHSVSEPWTTWMFDGRADDPSARFRGARYDDSQAVVPRAVQGHGLALARWVPPATGPSASSAAIGSFDPTGRTNSQASRPSSAGYGSKRQPYIGRPAPRSPRSYCFSGKTIQAILGTYILDSLIKKAPKWGKTRGESRCLTLPAGFLVPLLLLGWGAFP